MSARTLLGVTLLGAVLWGCTPALTIQTIGTPSATASRIDCSRTCVVQIRKSCAFDDHFCKFVIDYDEIHLARGSPNVSIVWVLPDGYVFCKKYVSDGGVVLKGTNDGQFSSMYSTDDANGGAPVIRDCSQHRYFHWTGVNTVPRGDAGYGYTIILFDRAGNQQQPIDPWIYND
ncbi:MAG TPA: hypothetical protein VMN79_16250 [Casimicrobiaceae bacterium]|nr:hypothetical protein [Casimicrobiaceae bacterium]